MSVWSDGEGTAWISVDSHFSLKEALKDITDEFVIYICAEDRIRSHAREVRKIQFEVSVCAEGEAAFKIFETFVQAIRRSGKYSMCEFAAEIRF